MRGIAYKRFQREKHIKRKENFLRKSRTDNPPHKYNDADMWSCTYPTPWSEGAWDPFYTVKYRGELSKGKIHCSCGMCMGKTRNKGYRRRHIHGNYAPSINYKHSDKQKVIAARQQVMDYFNDDDFLLRDNYDPLSADYDYSDCTVDGVFVDGVPLKSISDLLFESFNTI